jgi:hypothetical protein
MATLMLVVALERDRLPPTERRGERTAATVVAVWVVLAFAVSTADASVNKAFGPVRDALIIGALAAIMVLLVTVAVLPLRAGKS